LGLDLISFEQLTGRWQAFSEAFENKLCAKVQLRVKRAKQGKGLIAAIHYNRLDGQG